MYGGLEIQSCLDRWWMDPVTSLTDSCIGGWRSQEFVVFEVGSLNAAFRL